MYDGRIISISMIEGRDKAEEADGLRFEMQFMLKEWSGYKLVHEAVHRRLDGVCSKSAHN